MDNDGTSIVPVRINPTAQVLRGMVETTVLNLLKVPPETFTAYTVTKELRKVNPHFEIANDDVRRHVEDLSYIHGYDVVGSDPYIQSDGSIVQARVWGISKVVPHPANVYMDEVEDDTVPLPSATPTAPLQLLPGVEQV